MKKIQLGIIGLLIVSFLCTPLSAFAVNGGQWQAGRIIDDSVFYNSSSMTVDQIQQFLNSKVPQCDNWGTGAYNGTTRRAYSESKGVTIPLTCLKTYYENTDTRANNLNGASVPAGAKSAAQIIYDAAQAYAINPQVLLVLLQKEQSLITDEWPWPVQYQKATGYGCPDTAPCDAQYYGFYNQVSKAAWQFRRYATVPFSYNYLPGMVNNVRYNPNASCGSSSVYIQNQATASLYNYTPYQPNGAALNNLYGSGDSCSAYGNRNFWRLFNDWFGSTYGGPISGPVARIYNPITGDTMLVLDSKEQNVLRRGYNYWMNDGTAFEGYPSYEANTIPIYQLGRADGTHVYVTSGAEMDAAIARYGFTNDGVKFYAKTSNDGSSRPVYRLSRNGKYFYTVNIFEREQAVARGFADEGTAFYVRSNSTSIPIYRTSYRGVHLYTPSAIERDIAKMGGSLDEGVSFNAQSAATADAMPVYRLVKNGRYIFTLDRGERDALVIFNGYESEGAGFYGYPPGYASTTPVYRADRNSPEDHLYTPSPYESQGAVDMYGYYRKTNSFNQ